MASRMRWSVNHAVRAHTPYLRSISRAATPFLEAHISKMTRTHVRKGVRVPWNTVPVRTLNCFRQSRQRQTRRSLIAPVRVRREWPFEGRM